MCRNPVQLNLLPRLTKSVKLIPYMKYQVSFTLQVRKSPKSREDAMRVRKNRVIIPLKRKNIKQSLYNSHSFRRKNGRATNWPEKTRLPILANKRKPHVSAIRHLRPVSIQTFRRPQAVTKNTVESHHAATRPLNVKPFLKYQWFFRLSPQSRHLSTSKKYMFSKKWSNRNSKV